MKRDPVYCALSVETAMVSIASRTIILQIAGFMTDLLCPVGLGLRGHFVTTRKAVKRTGDKLRISWG